MEGLKEWVWEMRRRKAMISRRRDLTLQGYDIKALSLVSERGGIIEQTVAYPVLGMLFLFLLLLKIRVSRKSSQANALFFPQIRVAPRLFVPDGI